MKKKIKNDVGPQKEKVAEESPTARIREKLGLYRIATIITAIILIGLFFRLSVTLWSPLRYPDATEYLSLASEIHSGLFFSEGYDLNEGFIKSRKLPPLYPLLLSPFIVNSSSSHAPGVVISLIMSLLTFIPLYFAAKSILSRPAAIIACAIFSFHGFSLWYSNTVLTEATFTALYMTVFALAIYAFGHHSVKAFALTGVACALLFTTREVGFTAVWVVALAGLLKLKFIDRETWKKTGLALAALIVAFLVVSAPYFVNIRLRTGEWNLSAQVSNRKILNRIDKFGGDRYDRDQSADDNMTDPEGSASEKENRLLAIPVKTFSNTLAYGRVLLVRWDPLLGVFILIGIVGAVIDFRRDRNGEKLFMAAWTVVWILQLLLLCALLTPHMRDDRYIYPLMAPGIILAAGGLWRVARAASAGVAGDRKHAIFHTLVFLAGAIVYTFVMRRFQDPFAIRAAREVTAPHERLVILFPLLGVVSVFAMAVFPGIRLLSKSLVARFRTPKVLHGISAAAFILGAAMLSIWGGHAFSSKVPSSEKLYLIPEILGHLLVGGGIALSVATFMARGTGDGKSASVAIPALLITALFFSQLVDFIHVEYMNSKDKVNILASAGQREVAEELRLKGLVKPGAVIWARKPFIAFYLDGHPYSRKRGNVDVYDLDSALKLMKSGGCDYFVADSTNLSYYRPELIELAMGMTDTPGARLIYGKYLPEYKKVVCVYDCHKGEIPIPPIENLGAYIAPLERAMTNNELPTAYRILKRMEEAAPLSINVWRLKRQVLFIYYNNVHRYAFPTMKFAPALLPELLEAAQRCVELVPDDPSSKSLLEAVTRQYQVELGVMRRQEKGNRD